MALYSIIKILIRNLIKYSRIKKRATHFDVLMKSFDGAELCGLVGLFVLNKLSVLQGIDTSGLYRDDGLLLLIKFLDLDPKD